MNPLCPSLEPPCSFKPIQIILKRFVSCSFFLLMKAILQYKREKVSSNSKLSSTRTSDTHKMFCTNMISYIPGLFFSLHFTQFNIYPGYVIGVFTGVILMTYHIAFIIPRFAFLCAYLHRLYHGLDEHSECLASYKQYVPSSLS